MYIIDKLEINKKTKNYKNNKIIQNRVIKKCQHIHHHVESVQVGYHQ